MKKNTVINDALLKICPLPNNLQFIMEKIIAPTVIRLPQFSLSDEHERVSQTPRANIHVLRTIVKPFPIIQHPKLQRRLQRMQLEEEQQA